jgi:glycosyltransferase involved in cell wall biosynthesis
LVDPLNVQDIAEGMRRVIFDQALRTRLIARGLERAADFSWEKSASQVLALFSSLDHG